MIVGDNDTDDKFFAGINDAGEHLSTVTTPIAIKFIASINDTGEQ
jgi:hypothetical protein